MLIVSPLRRSELSLFEKSRFELRLLPTGLTVPEKQWVQSVLEP